MKVKHYLLITAATALLCTSWLYIFCYERIDAGYEGIKVNLYGSGKGVDDISLITGAVFYNPITTKVFEYPTFVQTVDYEPFEVNSKDGSKFTIDPSALIKIQDGKTPSIFKKYRKDLKYVVNTTLYVFIKDAARIEFNNYNADEIVSMRKEVDKSFEDRVRSALEEEGFDLQQLTPGIKYPQSYEEAIDAKNKAVQQRLQVENEVAVAQAEAEKILVRANAEAEANRLKNQALTPAILEKMWIDKWDGKLPVYGAVPSLFKDITK